VIIYLRFSNLGDIYQTLTREGDSVRYTNSGSNLVNHTDCPEYIPKALKTWKNFIKHDQHKKEFIDSEVKDTNWYLMHQDPHWCIMLSYDTDTEETQVHCGTYRSCSFLGEEDTVIFIPKTVRISASRTTLSAAATKHGQTEAAEASQLPSGTDLVCDFK
jgi:hypothetical protein